MNTSTSAYLHLEQQVAAWALAQPAIRAVLVIGSRARSDHLADEWSDLDLVVFAGDTAAYLDDATWLSTFGQVQAAVSDSFGQHDREWIALYADGCKIDVAFLSSDPAAPSTLQALLDEFPYPAVLQRGLRVLVNKTTTTPWSLPSVNVRPLPDQAEFAALIDRLLLDTLKAAKFIRRRDLWRAARLCNSDLKQHVLTMLEWHAAAQHDGRDIWYGGRYLDEWADRRALAVLPQTFATYHSDDLRRALLATHHLFQWLAQETAQQLGYGYPLEISQRLLNYLQTILSEETAIL